MALKDKQNFWKTLFEEKNVASELASVAAKPDGTHYHISNYGDVSFKCCPASSMGDNFMSDTFILMASTQDGTEYRGFVKVLPSNSMMREAAYGSRAHHREISMYRTFFDQLRLLRHDAGLSDHDVPLDVPDVYHVHLEEVVKDQSDGSGTSVLLQDLSIEGYRMTDKMEGCDDVHARLALASLAHYHALNMAALRKWKNPDGSYSFPPEAEFLSEKTMYDLMSPVEMYTTWLNGFVGRMKSLDRADLGIWLESLIENLEDIFQPDTLHNCGPLVCVLHGDYWNNNMLFKYDTSSGKDKPVEIKMIDFQISRFSHPLGDILYFLYSSTLPDVREKHMTAWLAHYFDTLTSSLKKLGVDLNKEGYTFSHFLAEYKKRSITWMLSASIVMAMVLEKKIVSNLQDMDKEAKENPKKVSETEAEVGKMGFSSDLEEKFKNMVEATGEASDPRLNVRMTKLFDEVKRLNQC